LLASPETNDNNAIHLRRVADWEKDLSNGAHPNSRFS